MDIYRVVMTPRAGGDLEFIYDHIAADSPQHAAAMIREILDAIELLRHVPERPIVERQTPKLRFPVRGLVVEPYIVYFRVISNEKVVRILHVPHSARRQPRRFG